MLTSKLSMIEKLIVFQKTSLLLWFIFTFILSTLDRGDISENFPDS